MTRALRAGRVFIDWAQNDERKQTVAPYSVRALEEPRVSTPLAWEEVGGAPLVFTIDDVLARVRTRGDVFALALERRQQLPEVRTSSTR